MGPTWYLVGSAIHQEVVMKLRGVAKGVAYGNTYLHWYHIHLTHCGIYHAQILLKQQQTLKN